MPQCQFRSEELAPECRCFICISPHIRPSRTPKVVTDKVCNGCHENLRKPLPPSSWWSWLNPLTWAAWLRPSTAYPSMAKQVANLGLTIIKDASCGFRRSSDAAVATRRSICLQCPSRKYERATGRCMACGCGGLGAGVEDVIIISSKACPLGHWRAE